MPISLNEIRSRAQRFVAEWSDESSERAEAQTFWNDFFYVFGVVRRRIAVFERSVTLAGGDIGRIDVFWKGVMLAEHKSRGCSLEKAFNQARDYFPGIPDRDLPRYIVVSDFSRFRVYDLEDNLDSYSEINLQDLPNSLELFGFISGYERKNYGSQDPVTIQAVEKLGSLHDALAETGFFGHPLEVFLVRILFCLFSEDSGIFAPSQFREFIDVRTAEDGSDVGPLLGKLFAVLDTAPADRTTTLDQMLADFPHVNGELFRERLDLPDFNSTMRNSLLECCALDWRGVSPAIFGSLFQSVMSPHRRRELGGHYTEESNILKTLSCLFIENLEKELQSILSGSLIKKKTRLREFQSKLRSLKFFDPACGCGNFLVVAYREIRRIELRTILELRGVERGTMEGTLFSVVDVDQFYGLELEEFPAQIAKVALWLTDHLANMELSKAFGDYYVRLPLTRCPKIIPSNALEVDWASFCPEATFIVGNPPYRGSKYLNESQRASMKTIFSKLKDGSILDYVSAWFKLAADYMINHPATNTAFVSTNSICQGEQVAPLWGYLLSNGVSIQFAHQTFQWSSQARGCAAVHCIILGLGMSKPIRPRLFEYPSLTGQAQERKVESINPYLFDAPVVIVQKRQKALSDVPLIHFGNMPLDGGHLLLSRDEKNELVTKEPNAKKFIKKFVGAQEFLNGIERWCLWLADITPEELRSMPSLLSRVDAVKKWRLSRKPISTKVHADTPWLFRDNHHPDSEYLIIPSATSKEREYAPIGYVTPDTVASNLVFIVPKAKVYHFGVLQSAMHMAWLRGIGGRLKSDYRYSKKLVYNCFCWPTINNKSKLYLEIESCAAEVLQTRSKYTQSSLSDLYDSRTMPADLRKAHRHLDNVVDRAYGLSKASETTRIETLFRVYAKEISKKQN